MRFSEAWLRSRVDPAIDTAGLVKQLTMAGLEVDSVEPAAGEFSGVVVAEILDLVPHPKADRLRVCRVDAGQQEPLQIVCGAPNAAAGLKIPLALEGAELPGGLSIRRSELRGVESFGMLCSGKELGIDDPVDGLWVLPADAPVGRDLRDYLALNDSIFEVDLTPNRADCLSVEGIAREVAVLNRLAAPVSAPAPVPVSHAETFPITVDSPDGCPRYLGRLIKGLRADAPSPLWMRERLRRSGLRSLGPAVDVTNYVLLELGQPLHAFDAAKLHGGIVVRHAQADEALALLNGQVVTLDPDVLVIADQRRALAMAGIMGGADSAVGDGTTDIFLECAFFSPEAIMGRARKFGLNTDSSHRFERGVDPQLQWRAIERATELLIECAGGLAGPVIEAVAPDHLPTTAAIALRPERVRTVLGLDIADAAIVEILEQLQMSVDRSSATWQVVPPSFRFDVAIEADLIEEVGRVYGYDNIPRRSPKVPMQFQPVPEASIGVDRIKDLLVDRGYQEAITYSFVDRKTQSLLEPGLEPIALLNPISAELGVMRTNLWCGLLDAAAKNLNRQHNRVRFFETGLTFKQRDNAIVQTPVLAGLALGSSEPEQWGMAERPIDFFDVKADVEALLALTGRAGSVDFRAAEHPSLHPGQTAEIYLQGAPIGWLGLLHPRLEKPLDLDTRVFLFELSLESLSQRAIPAFKPLCRFPRVRRDLALIVAAGVNVAALVDSVRSSGGELIREVVVFDVYQGQGIEDGKKSVAIGLILQDESETLTDQRVETLVSKVVAALSEQFSAKLRE